MDVKIRSMTRSEVRTLVDWAADEGWNPGQTDAELFWNLDNQGFLGLDVDGEFVGGGAIVRHNSAFGFMGLFIVDPRFRGQHLGERLWIARRDTLLDRLGEDATIGLDGVEAMVPFYQRGGFEPYTQHRRFTLTQAADSTASDDSVTSLNDVNFELIEQFDRTCFPGPRSDFLANWISQPGAISLAVESAQRLAGFGVMRPCRIGWKIGPLFAEETTVAEKLLTEFLHRSAGSPVFLDVPDNNPEAVRMCQSRNMEEVFGCTRMYLGPTPKVDSQKIFATTTLEVG